MGQSDYCIGIIIFRFFILALPTIQILTRLPFEENYVKWSGCGFKYKEREIE
jgi:hypothetical protein